MFPGGPNAVVKEAFEYAELLDYYEVDSDGSFDHLAQMRYCHAGCSDPVETITRRDVDAIIVGGISPHSLMRFCNAGVNVYEADGSSAGTLIASFLAGSLREIGMDRFATPGKTR